MANILTVTNGNDSGPGSLRDNIAIANLNPLITIINFDPSVTLVNLTSGSLIIKSSYTITGAGVNPTIDASSNILSTMFTCTIAGTIVEYDNLTLYGSPGGAIFANKITLSLTNVIINNNKTPNSGGGILIISCTCNIVSSIFTNNKALVGGAVFSSGCGIFIDLSTFNGNSADVYGGGLIISRANFTILNSTISNNTASGISPIAPAAGLYVAGTLSSETSTILNCTICNNNLQAGLGGGGVYLALANVAINNSTIAYNSANNGGGIYIAPQVQSTVYLNNTIVANNSAVNNPDISDISGNISSAFYNLIGNGTGNNIVNGIDNNIVGVPPLISTLANNGGPTQTIALLLGSPAIDSGSIPLTPPGTLYDQRQSPYLRVFGPNIDIGAFEFQQQPICYKASSVVLTKDLITNAIASIRADNVRSTQHQVYDTINKKFIDVKINAVTGNVSEFYLIKKNLFRFNQPSEDFYVTGGHKLLINNKIVKARDISKAVTVKLVSQPVYSICTEYQTPILINGLNVLTWARDDFLQYSKKRVLDFQDNI